MYLGKPLGAATPRLRVGLFGASVLRAPRFAPAHFVGCPYYPTCGARGVASPLASPLASGYALHHLHGFASLAVSVVPLLSLSRKAKAFAFVDAFGAPATLINLRKSAKTNVLTRP